MHGSSGRPTVLLFCPSFPAEPPQELLAELRGLGAELVAMTPRGGVLVSPDDDPRPLPPSPQLYRQRGVPLDVQLALFVLDEAGNVRFSRRGDGDAMPAVLTALRLARTAAHRAGGVSRREVLVGSLIAGLGLLVLDACAGAAPKGEGPLQQAATQGLGTIAVKLRVNGEEKALQIEPRVTLLDALRERLGLTGAKKGCDQGQCGSCTVLLDGERRLSCLTLAAQAQGVAITTIEGLARGDELHPMQAAFLAHDAFQCGYCTPGQILSAVALVSEGKAKTDDEIREQMCGNLCRCGAYTNIVAAIREVQGRA